jgi:hypothetical protein
MSWLFSRALVAEYLGENFSDGEQSAPLSGSHIQQAFCAPDKMTAFSRLSRFGMTYKPLTADRGEELLTLYLADFRAKTSALQEKVPESTAPDQACGPTWRGWLAKYDPDSYSWKTAQCSLIEDSGECLETFPRSGMTRDGLLWELPMLEQTTRGIESGLSEKWPTPNAGEAKQSSNLVRKAERRVIHAAKGVHLQESLTERVGGKLNPTWVEWLMGWPLGWTDLKPLVTVKSHCVQQQPGNYSENENGI